MITAVVFSRDRACQLDLLLTSLERNGGGLFDVHVLYVATTDAHQAGYKLCRERFPVWWQGEGRDIARAAADVFRGTDFGCFFTDDSVLYRPLPFPPTRLNGRILCFSLRLGQNTTWCYPLDRQQTLPEFSRLGDVLRWDWTQADADFGYPASVDGHVFRSTSLVGALHDCPPSANPNQMEEHLVKHFQNHSRTLMASYTQSCLVGVPVNVVSETHRNRHAGTHDPDDLNAKYLAGKRIRFGAMDFRGVSGAHQPINLPIA